MDFTPKTEKGRLLVEIRERAIANGMKLLSPEEIEYRDILDHIDDPARKAAVLYALTSPAFTLDGIYKAFGVDPNPNTPEDTQ